MSKATLSDIAKFLTNTAKKGDTSFWGKVAKKEVVNGETVYKVSLDGEEEGAMTCKKMSGAEVGDIVFGIIRPTGEAVVINTKGGDKDAASAAQVATLAGQVAQTAQQTAQSAQGTAEAAQDVADAVATDLASNYSTTSEVEQMIAQTSGGNSIYYAASAPSGTHKVGDTWFNTSAGYAIYRWNGSSWAKAELDTDAFAAGSITTSELAAGAVTAAKLAVGAISIISDGHGNSVSVDSDGVHMIGGTESMTEIEPGTLLVSAYNGNSEVDVNGGEFSGVGSLNPVVTLGALSGRLHLWGYRGLYLHTGSRSSTESFGDTGTIYAESDMEVAGDLDVSGTISGNISVDLYSKLSVTNETISMSSSHADGTSFAFSDKTISNSGYYPIGVVGVNPHANSLNVAAWLSSRSSGRATLSAKGNVSGSTAASGTINVKVLWVEY